MKKTSINPEKIISLAEQFDFSLQFHKRNNYLLRFQRDGIRIDVWYTSWTFGLYGQQQTLYFRNASEAKLIEIFTNPYKVFRLKNI